MFVYCTNNPVCYKDSSGMVALDAICCVAYDGGGGSGGAVSEPDPLNVGEGNYFNHNKEDLYSSTTNIYEDISKSEANMFYEKISYDDYEMQLAYNPITMLLPGLFDDFSDLASLITDIMSGSTISPYADIYDPCDRLLYLEEGYTVVTIDRTYIGNGYSANEIEYFIFDENLQLVFNDVRSIFYIID